MAAFACAIIFAASTRAHAHVLRATASSRPPFPPTTRSPPTNTPSLSRNSTTRPAATARPMTHEIDVSSEFDKEIFPKFAVGVLRHLYQPRPVQPPGARAGRLRQRRAQRQVPALGKRRARMGAVARRRDRPRRHRQQGARRRVLHHLHAHRLLRQRLRRPARFPRAVETLRAHRNRRRRPSRASRRIGTAPSTPTRSSLASRSSTACRTSSST